MKHLTLALLAGLSGLALVLGLLPPAFILADTATPQNTLTLTPPTVTLAYGQGLPFAATDSTDPSLSHTDLRWTVISSTLPAHSGTLTAQGIYLAPHTNTTVVIQASRLSNPSQFGQASITVRPLALLDPGGMGSGNLAGLTVGPEGQLFAFKNESLYRLDPAGRSEWEALRYAEAGIDTYGDGSPNALRFNEHGHKYLAAGSGVYYQAYASTGWTRLGAGLSNPDIKANDLILHHLTDGEQVYAAFGDGAVRLWDTRTANPAWQSLGQPSGSAVARLTLGDDGTLYAATERPNRVYRYQNNGQWQKIGGDLSELPRALEYHAHKLFVALRAGGAYHYDLLTGGNWQHSGGNAGSALLKVDDQLYLSGGKYVNFSLARFDDTNNSWEALLDKAQVDGGHLAADARGILYLGTGADVYRSAEGLVRPSPAITLGNVAILPSQGLRIRLNTTEFLSGRTLAPSPTITEPIGTIIIISGTGSLVVPHTYRLYLPLILRDYNPEAINFSLMDNPPLYWLSSNPAVATVNKIGHVTGLKVGTSTITAIPQANLSLRAQTVVTVYAPTAQISAVHIQAPTTTLQVSRSLQLHADVAGQDLGNQIGVTWHSSHPHLASVSQQGLVTAHAVGAVTITARAVADSSQQDNLGLTVTPSSLSSNPNLGQWLNLTYNLPPDDGQSRPVNTLTFYDANPSDSTPAQLYAGTNAGVWRLDEAAQTWTQVGNFGTYLNTIIDTAITADNTLYVANSGADKAVFRYQADGDWVNVRGNLNKKDTVSHLAYSAENDTLYALVSQQDDPTDNTQLFRFNAVITEWVKISDDLFAPAMRFKTPTDLLVVDGYLYTGGRDAKVKRIPLTGGAWEDITGSLPQADDLITANDAGICALGSLSDGTLVVCSDRVRNKLYSRAPGESDWTLMQSYAYGSGGVGFLKNYGDMLFSAAEGGTIFDGTRRISLGAESNLRLPGSIQTLASPDGGQTLYVAARSQDVGDQAIFKLSRNPFAPAKDLNLAVSTASYLGTDPNADEIWAVDIAPDSSLVFAGRSESDESYGVHPLHLLGGGQGLLLRLSPDGRAVRSVTRLGQTLHDMEISRETGHIAVATDFGVALLSAAGDRVLWSAQVAGGVDRLAISPDPNTGLDMLVTLAGKTMTVYQSDGTTVSQRGQRTFSNAFVEDVAIDGQTQLAFVTGFDNRTLPPDNEGGRLPVQVAYLYSYGYDLGERGWTNWNYNGDDLLNNQADTRGYRLAMGRDNQLYFLGENAGGNSIFRWDPQDPADANCRLIADREYCALRMDSASSPLRTSDVYNTPVQTAAPHFVFYARLNPATGQAEHGQFAIPRLSNGNSNTYRARAITADEAGRVYVAGVSASAIENRQSLFVGGQAVAPYSGGDAAVLVVSPDFSTRLNWTAFTGPAEGSHYASVEGIAATRGLAVAGILAEQGRELVINPWPGYATPSPSLSPVTPDAYFAVWPTE